MTIPHGFTNTQVRFNRTFRDGGFSSEAQTVFDLMDTDPPTLLKVATATLIDSQVVSGNWAILQDNVSQFLAYVMDTEANGRIDWIGNFDALNVNSTPHTPYSGEAHSGFAGFAPDGLSKYINTVIKPSELLLSDVFHYVWIFQNSDAGSVIINIGAHSGGGTETHLQQTATDINVRVNSSNFVTDVSAPLADNSSYDIVRIDASNTRLGKGGAQVKASAGAVGSASTQSIYHGCWNANGAAASFNDCQICMKISGRFTGFDLSNLHDNVLIFLQTLGIEA